MTRPNSKKQDEGMKSFVGNVEEFLKTEAEEGKIARMTDTALIDRMFVMPGVDMEKDVGGEGKLRDLIRKRQATFGGKAKMIQL